MPDNIKQYITNDPNIKGGKAVILGTRVTVAEIIDFLENQKFINAVVKQLKSEGVLVTNKEVFAALEYAKYFSLDETKAKKKGP